MKFLFIPLKERRALCMAYVLMGFCIQLLEAYGAALFSDVINALGDGRLTVSRCGIYLSVLATVIVLSYLEEAPDAALKKDFELRFRLMAMEKARGVDYLSCAKLGTGTLLTRMENGAAAGRDILFFYFCCIRELIPGAFFSLAFIFSMHRGVFAGVLAGYGVVWAVTRLLLTRLEHIKEGVLTGEEELGRISVRALTEVVPLRLCGLYPGLIQKAHGYARSVVKNVTKMRMTHEAFFAGFALLTAAAKAAVLIAAALTDGMDVGTATALLLLVDKAYQPVAVFSVSYVSYKLNRAAFARYDRFLSLADEKRMDRGDAIVNVGGDIRMERVSLALEGRQIVQDASTVFAGGRFTVLCGESGSGKSTLLKMIAGLQRPDCGEIMLGTQSLLNAYLPSLYTKMAYVTQEPPVLDGTIRENLIFDAGDRDGQAIEALRAVGLGGWFARLPQGLDTSVGEHGFALSGGERQRLCLARVLLSGAQLILLDEATSALDALSEEELVHTLRERLTGRTVLFCAHRLRAARDADHIVVMQEGKIVEEGNFDALVKTRSIFAGLWRAQLRQSGGDAPQALSVL